MKETAVRRVVVTGASSGIGRATAILLGQEGARVGLLARDKVRLGQTASAVRESGSDALPLSIDLTSGHQVEEAFASIRAAWGGVDVLCNVAGAIGRPVGVAALSETDWDRLIGVNLKATFLCCRAVWNDMAAHGGGVIINTASVLATRGLAGMSAYCAAKAGVLNLTRALAQEGAPIGIRVNCVSPGFIDTPMNKVLASWMPDAAAWRQSVLEQIPLGRAGTPQEVGEAIAFLASERASFVTGIEVRADGGSSAG